jgi:hypothetical protein
METEIKRLAQVVNSCEMCTGTPAEEERIYEINFKVFGEGCNGMGFIMLSTYLTCDW